MASVRVKGVCAKVDDRRIIEKAKKVREALGSEYRIIIEKGKLCIEGDMLDAGKRKQIEQILAS